MGKDGCFFSRACVKAAYYVKTCIFKHWNDTRAMIHTRRGQGENGIEALADYVSLLTLLEPMPVN